MSASNIGDAHSQRFVNYTEVKPTMSTTMSTSKVSYAQVTQNVFVPKKDHAIVVDAIEGITIKEYTMSIGKLVGPTNIRFRSRISHGRVCLYLSSQTIVDTLLSTHKNVNISGHILEIRPLVSPAKRIILSNVCPTIPNNIIENKLIELNISRKSQISYIRAGMTEPGYSHILSFRRQVYIDPDDINKLPDAMQINYDNTLYWIYISTVKLTCFICKAEGHLAKHCKNSGTVNQESSVTVQQEDHTFFTPMVVLEKESSNDMTTYTQVMDDISDNNNLSQEIHQDKQASNEENNSFKVPLVLSIKRPRSDTSSVYNSSNLSEIPSTTDIEIKKTICKNIKKKNKKSKSIKSLIKSTTQNPPLSVENLSNFIVESLNNSDIQGLASKFTNDTPALIEMLQQTQKHIKKRKYKALTSSIIKKLLPNKKDTSSEDFSSSEDQ